MTLEGTPAIVTPSAIAGLSFENEITTVNALVPELVQQGAAAIVVLVHEGGFPTGLYNECPGLSGAIVPIEVGLDPAVDVIVSAHTHHAYNCTRNGRLLTSAASFGRIVTQIELTIDPAAKKVTAKKASNVIVTRDVAPDVAVQSILATYTTLAAPLANRVIGHVQATLAAVGNAAGEAPLGDVIADAMLAATAKPGFGDAVIAFMNPGGVRADLVYNAPDGKVTYAQAFTTQPFGNSLVTLTLTGDQLHRLLEQQFAGAVPKVLQVSSGFTYAWSALSDAGSRIDPASITLNGVALDPAASYRVTVNSFLATGGDGFSVLAQATARLGGAIDVDALVAYLGANDPLTTPAANRIVLR
jgi:5'-nucleotidase